MVKIALYLNDVDEGGGPLQIVHLDFPASNLATEFTYPALSQEKLDASLGAPIRDSDVTTRTGVAGTVIFSDTASPYHRGKPAVSRDRGAVFYNYSRGSRATRSSASARAFPARRSPDLQAICRPSSAPASSGATRCRRSPGWCRRAGSSPPAGRSAGPPRRRRSGRGRRSRRPGHRLPGRSPAARPRRRG